jgi:diguanylate cyclase (GGDEF)-like protein
LTEPTSLYSLVIDSLEDQIAVVDSKGSIVYVNRAWITFGLENGLASGSFGVGSNYLEVCNTSGSRGDSLAGEAAQGLLDVLGGKRTSFYFEYPCHGPDVQRWFMMRVAPLLSAPEKHFVISHHNITQRKLAEEKVEHLSLHDPLTGLANRRYFDQFLKNEWRRNIRSRTPVSFIMFDLDQFKAYNDDLGHVAGDDCLVKVARVFRDFAGRSGDLAVRYGGEEFGLLLGETGQEASVEIAETIRRKIRELDITYSGATKRITVSAGVAYAVPENPHGEESLVLLADKALYRAKQMGRDRIACAQAAETE